MEIISRREGNVVILDVHGQISLGESKEKFARAMDALFAEQDVNVLVNFEGINYLDSTGIGELIGYMNKFVENNRHLKILRPHERIRKLLKITKLDTVFEIYEDEDQALKSFSRS
jgi:anti-sigma B factor antagonist